MAGTQTRHRTMTNRKMLLWSMLLVGVWDWGFLQAAPVEPAAAEHGWITGLLQGPEVPPEGFALLACLLLIALGTLVTEDLTCVVTGLLIANGTLSWAEGIWACLAGILFGDFLLYFAGRKLGRPALSRAPLKWMIDPIRLYEAEQWFQRRGGLTILISRFIPGTRLPAFVAAGLLGISYVKFLYVFVIAALLWTPAIIFLAAKLAGNALRWLESYQHAAPLILPFLIVCYLLLFKVMIPSLSWRGRRQLLGRWRRLTRPEYWPTWLLYFPVVVMLLTRLFKKGQHPMDFSACNPCMEDGGVVEESKKQILDQFADREAVAEYALLSGAGDLEERVKRATVTMEEKGFAFPVVLKPDVGQRGSQVVIAKAMSDVRKALSGGRSDFLLQRYIPGVEFGEFYIRHPDEKQGRIFAVTRKTFARVTGDGKHNVEELILLDDRALCQAEMHFRQCRECLFDVPAPGERVQLTDVGNHSRGTLFEDGMALVTP